MSLRNYVAIATVLRRNLETTVAIDEEDDDKRPRLFVEKIIRDIANVFAEDNARFNRSTFYAACGYKPKEQP